MSERLEKIGGFDADLPLAAVAKESIEKEEAAKTSAEAAAKERAAKNLAEMEENRAVDDGRGGMRHERPEKGSFDRAMRRFRRNQDTEEQSPTQAA